MSMKLNLFNEIDRINAEYKRRYMPETEIDPECATALLETRIEDSATWLRENPESLLDVDIDALVAIWKAHHKDKLDLGECFDRYMEGLIQEQARESVEIELNIE